MRNIPRLAIALALFGFAACSKTPTQELGEKDISGWFAKSEFNGRGIRLTHYWFMDGNVYLGHPPGGVTSSDFKTLEHSQPANFGTYKISGHTLTIERKGGASEKHSYSTAGGGIMDSSPLIPAWRFPNGAKLEGRWSINAVSNFGGVYASSSKTWKFHNDGTVEASGHAGVDGKTATSVSSSSQTARYQFQDGKLTITYKDGSKESHDAYGTGKQSAPYILGIDGVDYPPN